MKCARVIANIFTYAAELIIFAFITDMNQAENRSVSDGNRTKRRLLPCSKSDADHFFIADIFEKTLQCFREREREILNSER